MTGIERVVLGRLPPEWGAPEVCCSYGHWLVIRLIARNRLLCARQKLLAAEGPDQWRKVSWFRLCCTLLGPGIYPRLLRNLFLCDKEWWKKCYVSREGVLFSVNPRLDALLQPVSRLQAQVAALPEPSLPPMDTATKRLACAGPL